MDKNREYALVAALQEFVDICDNAKREDLFYRLVEATEKARRLVPPSGGTDRRWSFSDV